MDFLEELHGASRAFRTIQAFEFALDVLLAFVVSATILYAFGISIYYCALPVAVYSVLRLRKMRKTGVLAEISKDYPDIEEVVKTANDNKGQSSFIIDRLMSDAASNIATVQSSSFVDRRRIMSRCLLLVVFTFLFMSVTFVKFEGFWAGVHMDLPDEAGKIINAVPFLKDSRFANPQTKDQEVANWTAKETLEEEKVGGEAGGERPGYAEGPLPGSGGGIGSEENRDIYGDMSMASLYGQNIKMKVRPDIGGTIEIRDIDGKDEYSKFEVVGAESSGQFSEDMNVEHEAAIRRYFELVSAAGV